MSSYQPGSTVLAVRNGSTDCMYIFGEGVYVGDRPMPGTPDEVPADDYEAIKAVFDEDDTTPYEEHRVIAFIKGVAEAQGDDVDQAVGDAIVRLDNERAKPMDVRIRELYRDTRSNPCIYLDSGDIVWGFQCWWGPPKRFLDQAPLAVRVVVPVPEENERWK